MPQNSNQSQQASFSALYLQRTTQELSEDLDKIRNADDFKVESVPFLVHALQQGAQQFSASQQNAVLKTSENRQGWIGGAEITFVVTLKHNTLSSWQISLEGGILSAISFHSQLTPGCKIPYRASKSSPIHSSHSVSYVPEQHGKISGASVIGYWILYLNYDG